MKAIVLRSQHSHQSIGIPNAQIYANARKKIDTEAIFIAWCAEISTLSRSIFEQWIWIQAKKWLSFAFISSLFFIHSFKCCCCWKFVVGIFSPRSFTATVFFIWHSQGIEQMLCAPLKTFHHSREQCIKIYTISLLFFNSFMLFTISSMQNLCFPNRQRWKFVLPIRSANQTIEIT